MGYISGVAIGVYNSEILLVLMDWYKSQKLS